MPAGDDGGPNDGTNGGRNGASPSPPGAVDRIDELRALLVAPERDRLSRVERQLANPSLHAEALAESLPDAVRRRTARDAALGEALGPVVGDAIRASVRRDPQPLVDAIFPVIGPAIRRSIGTALAELVQSLNASLEHTFSARGLAWRWEAMRTGKSFGEVVISHSLLFRVEQLFLIDRESGLLIEHRVAPGVQAPAPDMVASMMTALSDFARDSFSVSAAEGLDALELGELTLWVESGPQAMLAAVIRGHAPVALRGELQRSLEDVHRIHAADIDRFRETGVSFTTMPGVLDRCLVSKLQSRNGVAWRTWALVAAVLAVIAIFLVPRVLEGRRFDRFLARLRGEPGIVVARGERERGGFVVEGLRDPLAVDPATLLAASGVSSDRVQARWEPYVALHPAFMTKRAVLALRPPAGVTLRVAGDTLVGDGVAPRRWIERATLLAPALGGIGVVRLAGIRDSAVVALQRRADSLAQVSFDFALGSAVPLPGQGGRVDSLAAALAALHDEGTGAGLDYRITFIGSADTVGTEATNAALRAARAARIRALLVDRGVTGTILQTETDSSSRHRLRQVRLRITVLRSDSLSAGGR